MTAAANPISSESPTTGVFSIPVRVYYEDTDAAGVVYYGNYLRFMERCRTEWLRHIGFDVREVSESFGLVFAVHSADIRYLKPARLSDLLSVSSSVVKCGRVSLDVTHEVRRQDELLSRGRVKLAALDAESLRPRPIPIEIREGINTWKMP